MSPPSGSNLWPSSVTLTLNRYGRNMGSAHRLHEVNIWHKFHENPSSRFGDMERTRFYGQTDRQTDRQSDRQTDIRHKNNISPLYYRGRHNNKSQTVHNYMSVHSLFGFIYVNWALTFMIIDKMKCPQFSIFTKTFDNRIAHPTKLGKVWNSLAM